MSQQRCKKTAIELRFETFQVTKIFLNFIYIYFSFPPVYYLHSNLISDFSYILKYFVRNLGFTTKIKI